MSLCSVYAIYIAMYPQHCWAKEESADSCLNAILNIRILLSRPTSICNLYLLKTHAVEEMPLPEHFVLFDAAMV